MKKILSVLLVFNILNTNLYAGTHALERAANALNEAMKIGEGTLNNLSCSIDNLANNYVSSSATSSSSVGFIVPHIINLPCNYN